MLKRATLVASTGNESVAASKSQDDLCQREPSRGRASSLGLAGIKILVVDDDEDFRVITADVLRQLGMDVVEAEDGNRALAVAEREKPDAILLDQRMPGLLGTEVVSRLRQRGDAVTVILATAARDAAEIAARAGLTYWLQKPFGIDELRDVLRRACVLREDR